MAFLELTKEGNIAVIKMNNGKNTQDLVFAKKMNSLLGEVMEDQEAKALVIISTDEKNWSQGIDLDWMIPAREAGNHKDVDDFFINLDQVYSKLMLLPMPTIAAINGHAFGAGSFLATACDYRFMNGERGFFCFPEITLKMDFLPGVFHMLNHKLPHHKLQDLIYTGKHATGAELERFFLVERSCAGVEDTINTSMKFARNFDQDRKIMASYKEQFHGSAARNMIELNLKNFGRI